MPDVDPEYEPERVEAMRNPGLRIITVRNTASGDAAEFSEEAWQAFLDARYGTLTESERFQVEEARATLAGYGASRHLTGATDSLHTQPLRNLLALLDKIAPKDAARTGATR